MMRNSTKLTCALIAFTLLFTACSKDDDPPQPEEQVANEITAEELFYYMIIEEYLAEASSSYAYGDKPLLEATFIERNMHTNKFEIHLIKADGNPNRQELQTTYDANTGITSISTAFGYYDLTRDQSGQIVVIKSRHHEDSNHFTSRYFDSQYIQLVKRGFNYFHNKSYKNTTGKGYYRFDNGYAGFYADRKWLYKENAVPATAELTWYWNKTSEDANIDIWHGQDDGTAKYHNLFIALPKGAGWKGQHKDKDLMLVNTIVNRVYYKSVGDIGVYERIN